MKPFLFILSLYLIFEIAKLAFYSSKKLAPITWPKEEIMGEDDNITYLASGDSTAVGRGASSKSSTYTYQIAQHLGLSTQVRYANIGTIGAKTEDLIKLQLPQILELNPKVLTISIGANDLTHFVTSKEILGNYQLLKDALLEQSTATIYITNIPNLKNAQALPLWGRWLLDQKAKSLNKKIALLESDRFHIVDIHDFGWESYPDIQKTFAQDKFHPSDLGYENWTRAFLSRIQKPDQ